MTFLKSNGQKAKKNVVKYLIKWSGKTRSKYQDSVKFSLRPFWKGHVVYEEFPVVGTKMTLDFVNLTRRIAVEVQGEQHQEYNKHFHNGSKNNFYNQLDRDIEKKEWCELNKLELIEVFPHDIPLTEAKMEEIGLI